jgi:hypothetical protein
MPIRDDTFPWNLAKICPEQLFLKIFLTKPL